MTDSSEGELPVIAEVTDNSNLSGFQPRPVRSDQRKDSSPHDCVWCIAAPQCIHAGVQFKVTNEVKVKQVVVIPMCALERKRTSRPLNYVPIQTGETYSDAMIDTGAMANAMPYKTYNKLRLTVPHLIREHPGEETEYKISTCTKDTREVLKVVTLRFLVGREEYSEKFLVLNRMNSIILGLPFQEDNHIYLKPDTRTLVGPDWSLQLNEVQFKDSKKVKTRPDKDIWLVTTMKLTLPPNRQDVAHVVAKGKPDFGGLTGVVTPFEQYERKAGVCITSSLSQLDARGLAAIGVFNAMPHDVTIPVGTRIATMQILTAKQAAYLKPMDPMLAAKEEITSTDKESATEFNQLSVANDISEDDECWFKHPENCDDPSKLTGVFKRIYDSIVECNRKMALDPTKDEASRKEFLGYFNWEKSEFTPEQRAQIEELCVKYHTIFARHKMDVGRAPNFKVKLTPEHNDPVYKRSPPTPIHLRDDMLVELALLQYHDIITTLKYSKYSSPLFAQRKPDGKLRMLLDLRRINHLIRHDYDNNNYPVASLMDAAMHFSGKPIKSKMDCAQAFHGIEAADKVSVQLMSFNFASRTFAYKRLAQGLSRSATAFSSYIRQSLHKCITNDQCEAYMDDIGAGSHTFEEHVVAIEAIFDSIKKAGLRLSMSKCEFGVKEIEFLGMNYTADGVQPIRRKIEDFLETMKMPKTVRQIQRLAGFCQFYKYYIPHLAHKLLPFYQLILKNEKFKISDEHKLAFDSLKDALRKCIDRTLKQPLAGKQYVMLTDASKYAAGFVLMIEDKVITKKGKEIKQFAPVAFGSKKFEPAQLRLSIFAKEFLAVYMGFTAFKHILWGVTDKPVLVLTDNVALSRFFQAKTVPETLCNYVDQVLQFKWTIGHIPGKANPAADYLSRMYEDPHDKLQLHIASEIPCKKIVVDLEPELGEDEDLELASQREAMKNLCTGDENVSLATATKQELIQSFTVQPSNRSEEDDKVLQVIQLVEIEVLDKKVQCNELEEVNPLDRFDLTNRRHRLDVAAEQRKDPLLRTVIQWVEQRRVVNLRHHGSTLSGYQRQLNRLVVEDDILYRKYYSHTGKDYVRQICLPEQLQKEIKYRIHNARTEGHRGVRKTLEEFRKRFYYPGYQENIQHWIENCTTCLQTKPTPEANLRPPLQPLSSLAVRPGHMMQIDLVSNMPKAGPYRHVFTGIDVFSKYMFAVPLARVHARDVAAALMSMFLRHSYIPEVILTDLGSAFTSSLMKEVTDLLEIELCIATVKHPQTIGLLERAHATFKKHLKMYESANHTDWYKDVDYAVFSHNTSYRLETGATPACIFQGHTPIKPLDMRFGNKALLKNRPVFEPTQEIKDRLLRLYRRQKEYLVNSYMQYKDYHDEKANAKPLKVHDYCLVLNPLLDNQRQMMDKLAPKWLPTYRVEKKWTNENYLVRKCGTHLTQNVHRIRLRPFVPQYEVPDEDQVDPSRFVRDDTIPREPEIFDDVREAMTRDRIDNQARYTTTDIEYVPPPGPSDEPYPDLDQQPRGRLVLTPPDPEAPTEDEPQGHGLSQGVAWRYHNRDLNQGVIGGTGTQDSSQGVPGNANSQASSDGDEVPLFDEDSLSGDPGTSQTSQPRRGERFPPQSPRTSQVQASPPQSPPQPRSRAEYRATVQNFQPISQRTRASQPSQPSMNKVQVNHQPPPKLIRMPRRLQTHHQYDEYIMSCEVREGDRKRGSAVTHMRGQMPTGKWTSATPTGVMDDMVVRFTTKEKMDKLLGTHQKYRRNRPMVGQARLTFDKKTERHWVNLIIAASGQPASVANVELALWNLSMLTDSEAMRRIHIPMDQRITRDLDDMETVLAVERQFADTPLEVLLWNTRR